MDYVKSLKKLYKAPDLSASMIIDTWLRNVLVKPDANGWSSQCNFPSN